MCSCTHTLLLLYQYTHHMGEILSEAREGSRSPGTRVRKDCKLSNVVLGEWNPDSLHNQKLLLAPKPSLQTLCTFLTVIFLVKKQHLVLCFSLSECPCFGYFKCKFLSERNNMLSSILAYYGPWWIIIRVYNKKHILVERKSICTLCTETWELLLWFTMKE